MISQYIAGELPLVDSCDPLLLILKVIDLDIGRGEYESEYQLSCNSDLMSHLTKVVMGIR